MPTRVYNLVTSALTADSDDAANSTIIRDGKVVAINFVAKDVASTDSEWLAAVTKAPGSTAAFTNENISVLVSLAGGFQLETSGAAQVGNGVCVTGIGIPVKAGEKFYVVFDEVAGAANCTLLANIYVEER